MPPKVTPTATPAAADPTVKDLALQLSLLEHERNILGISSVEERTLHGRELVRFESQLSAADAHWEAFNSLWQERVQLQALLGTSGDFPSPEWKVRYTTLQNEMIEARTIVQMANSRDSPRVSTPRLDTTTSYSSSSRPALPRIPIPSFSGDILTWTHFRDTFLSMVHKEPSLSNVEKFHYLIGALKGEAAALLSCFAIEDGSYNIAWEKVVSTYDNPRVLGSLLIHRILECSLSCNKSELHRYDDFLAYVADSIESFRALHLVNPEEFLMTTLALRALDPETRKQFEMSIRSSSTFPTSDDVIRFVRERRTALRMSSCMINSVKERSQPHRHATTSYPNRRASKYNPIVLHMMQPQSDYKCGLKASKRDSTPGRLKAPSAKGANPSIRCPHCQGPHHLYHCEGFAALPYNSRISVVKSYQVCLNCLRKGHKVNECSSKYRCQTCKGKHHTRIHPLDTNTSDPTDKDEVPSTSSFIGFGAIQAPQGTVLLSTAQVIIKGQNGDHQARAILDSGSQQTFISYNLARKISSKFTPFKGSIKGLGESTVSTTQLKGCIPCVVRSLDGNHEFETNSVVVDRISSHLPTKRLPVGIFERLRHLPLADSLFAQPACVDMLIGGDLYPRLITGAPYDSGVSQLFLTPTIFGLVVSGTSKDEAPDNLFSFYTEAKPNIESQLKRFWELEEPCQVRTTDPADDVCEDHFLRTHSRNNSGRYIVRLPFKKELVEIGCNRDQVFQRFYSLERKLSRNRELSEAYTDFMAEYIQLNHMSPALHESPYLIPHHGVWQFGETGPKLRVVFDASCPSSSSSSLNDTLFAGPSLQNDLCNVLIQFRLYAVPLCADLVKMYRQILLHPDDRHHQHILWRDSCKDSIIEHELNTVTYGIKPSAFLSIRTLRQLVVDEGASYPLAAPRVLSDMYVDDFVSGADSVEEAFLLQQEMTALFAKGGFTLSKWASTVSELIPKKDTVSSINIPGSENEGTKILGLIWNSTCDSFSYTVRKPPSLPITKRAMLSAVARIFDPLGLLAPVTFSAKAMIQEVWKANRDWDDELPTHLAQEWIALTNDWNIITSIYIPRYISLPNPKFILIGFCDASQKGYAASLYLRTEGNDNECKISLVKSKTKVAPLKYVSIARLELCGAFLLSQIISSVPESLKQNVMCFTDSQVVLSWLKTPQHLLKTFEANRVAQITNVVPPRFWSHVRSEENPADIASRGCDPVTLKGSSLWWNGPNWLKNPVSDWYKSTEVLTVMGAYCTDSEQLKPQSDWTERFSSYNLLIRVIARILRLSAHRHSVLDKTYTFLDKVSTTEFRRAETRCLGYIQQIYLPKTMFQPPSVLSREYAKLSPFLDEQGIIRVGGRLNNAPLPTDAKHPILVPYRAWLARLIIKQVHDDHFHSGSNLTLSLVRGKYWIPRARKLIHSVLQQCVSCRLRKANPTYPRMSALPRDRFHQSRAFTAVGVDYAGPFHIKESRLRNSAIGKAYLCLFVCLASKALHLELVPSLTTSAFLAALERFVARRGIPTTIWSDHGTNFVGASRFLKDVYKFQSEHRDSIICELAPKGIEWKFIPPHAPHFGGIWEAGVKSVKGLLAGSIGKQACSYDELNTALVKVEGLLNSRPLCPMSDDPDDLNYLTPGHFISGSTLYALPDLSSPPKDTGSLKSRWSTLQTQIASVWRRWRNNYLHHLQERSKWTRQTPNLMVGDLVILIEKRSLLGQWPVARVEETFPGRDGTVRSVLVRTPSGHQLTRAVTSLAPLHSTPPEKAND